MTTKLEATLPELRLTGQYKLSGQVFALKVDGQGPFWTIISLSNAFPLFNNSTLIFI